MPRTAAGTSEHQLHVCAVCGRQEPVDVAAFVAGAQVVEGALEWRCARHRVAPPQGHQWIDCPPRRTSGTNRTGRLAGRPPKKGSVSSDDPTTNV